MGINYLDVEARAKYLSQIVDSSENKRRKNASLMQYEIYKKRQHPFVVEKILNELGADAAANSRIISSINLTPKITDEKAKIYLKAPERTFEGLSEAQKEHVENIYKLGKANMKLKKSNKIYKLQQQACLQIVPRDGIIEFRPLYAHNYDVIPKENDPEKAECYIISSYDKRQLFTTVQTGNGGVSPVENRGYYSDGINQETAEADDYKTKMLFYWWTAEYNFVTNFKGQILDAATLEPVATVKPDDIKNPIGELPFIDIADDKDFEFFVREGNSTVDFTLDFSTMLSDAAEIARLQGFAQAVMSSVEEPKELKIGPRKYLWLKKSPNGTPDSQPSFAFVSPSPDIAATNQMQANYLSMFLTTIGLSPKVVNSKGEAESYTSGFDRYLSMLEKFESSQDDLDLFCSVEKKTYGLVVKWNNVYASATENGFVEELRGVSLPDDSEMEVKFSGPEMTMSETEKLDAFERKRELGLMSRLQMIMKDQGLDEKSALLKMKEIDEQNEGDIENQDDETEDDPEDPNADPKKAKEKKDK